MTSNRFLAMAMAGTFLILGAQAAISQTETEKEPDFRPRMRGGQPFMRGPQGGFMHMRMLRALNLAEDQRQQIWEFQSEHFEETKEEREALLEAQEHYQMAVEALEAVNDGDGRSKLRKAAMKLADKQAALAIASAGHKTEFLDFLNSILDPDQWEEFQKIRTEMEQLRKERTERRKERRQDLH
jgi:Spy/CpxP family protein refolding chaperone